MPLFDRSMLARPLPARRLLAAAAGLALGLTTLVAAGAEGAVKTLDDACSASLVKARWYTLHPAKVHSTKSATCVLTYVNSLSFTDDLTTSAGVRYRSVDHRAYGEFDDGDDVVTYESRYRERTGTGLSLIDRHHEQDAWDLPDARQYDELTLQYISAQTSRFYTMTPNTSSGWVWTQLTDSKAQIPLLGDTWLPATHTAVTHWSRSTTSTRITWRFTLTHGTSTIVVDRQGRLISAKRSLSYDQGRAARSISLLAVYGDAVPWVHVPAAVVSSATAG